MYECVSKFIDKDLVIFYLLFLNNINTRYINIFITLNEYEKKNFFLLVLTSKIQLFFRIPHPTTLQYQKKNSITVFNIYFSFIYYNLAN